MEAVTQASLLEAIRQALTASPDSSGAMTAGELAAEMKCSVETMRKRLSPLIKDGRAMHVQVERETISGRVQRVPGYRLKS